MVQNCHAVTVWPVKTRRRNRPTSTCSTCSTCSSWLVLFITIIIMMMMMLTTTTRAGRPTRTLGRSAIVAAFITTDRRVHVRRDAQQGQRQRQPKQLRRNTRSGDEDLFSSSTRAVEGSTRKRSTFQSTTHCARSTITGPLRLFSTADDSSLPLQSSIASSATTTTTTTSNEKDSNQTKHKKNKSKRFIKNFSGFHRRFVASMTSTTTTT